MSIQISSVIALVPLQFSDAEVMFPLIDSDRNNLGQYLDWVDSVTDIETTRGYLQRRIKSGLNGAAWYKIEFNHTVVGVFGVKVVRQSRACAEIGYWLHSDYQGNGIVTQTVTGFCEHLKAEGLIQRVEIQCLAENKASIAVALRLGGRQTGTIPNYRVINGMPQTLKIYTIKLRKLVE